MHAMVEQTSQGHAQVTANDSAGQDYGAESEGLLIYNPLQAPSKASPTEIGLMVIGLLLPLVTQVGHAHAHGH